MEVNTLMILITKKGENPAWILSRHISVSTCEVSPLVNLDTLKESQYQQAMAEYEKFHDEYRKPATLQQMLLRVSEPYSNSPRFINEIKKIISWSDYLKYIYTFSMCDKTIHNLDDLRYMSMNSDDYRQLMQRKSVAWILLKDGVWDSRTKEIDNDHDERFWTAVNASNEMDMYKVNWRHALGCPQRAVRGARVNESILQVRLCIKLKTSPHGRF